MVVGKVVHVNSIWTCWPVSGKPWYTTDPSPAFTMSWKAKDLNFEATGKKHYLKICAPATGVHVASTNVPWDSFFLRLNLSHRISTSLFLEWGHHSLSERGSLANTPNAARWTAMWFSYVPVISFEIALKRQFLLPRTLSRMFVAISPQLHVSPELVRKGCYEHSHHCMHWESELRYLVLLLGSRNDGRSIYFGERVWLTRLGQSRSREYLDLYQKCSMLYRLHQRFPKMLKIWIQRVLAQRGTTRSARKVVKDLTT